MKRKTILLACLALNYMLVITVINGMASEKSAGESSVHHDLTIALFPETSELAGRDRMRIQGFQGGHVELFLGPRARIQAVRVEGHDRDYTFDRGRLTLKLDQKGSIPTVNLSLDYTCRFDDPAPARPVNTDNPGFGVSGTISSVGTFILSGAGWYPQIADQMAEAHESFNLRVEGPKDTVAVTAGRLMGIDRQGDKTISRWRIDNPLEGLSLSAGPYVVQQQKADDISAATFLFPPNRELSARYVEASLGYLKRYSDLFGAYPYDGFAVVENFFPTGYGFPGYTLMGGMVLRLPFIPHTSLPHEIVHNWWGNGVLVDFASGNWCEGLATYTADYLNKERASPDAAMDYRRQALRNFTSLVSPTSDFALSRFRSRTDPATKAVGYDKSAMVFHMLRRQIGDAAFWTALRDLYSEFLFKRAAWQDLQQRFERRARRSLDGFFRQWVERSGAPQLRLENVRQVSDDYGYRITGRLVQTKPYYDITLELVLNTEDGPIGETVHLSERQTQFEINSSKRPRALMADPDYHLFRRLSPEEMPPTVNTLKGSAAVVLVITNRMGRLGEPMARRFAQALGVEPIRTVHEADFTAADAVGKDLLFIGLPDNPELTDLLPADLALVPETFELAGQRFDKPGDVLFLVADHPDHSETVVSLLHPLSPDAADRAIMKIPHYGRYSYLAFSQGRNRAKGTWEVKASPMMVRWTPPN